MINYLLEMQIDVDDKKAILHFTGKNALERRGGA